MLNLSDALPRQTIMERYPEAREQVVVSGVRQLREERPQDIPAVALFVWDEMAHRGVTSDPQKMQAIYPDNADRIFDFVQDELGSPPITDAYYARWFNNLHDKLPFIKIELCQCYPSDIHIADVVFADLARPVKDVSEVSPRFHRGLSIFDEFLDLLREVARDRDVERISLVAASPAAHTFFSRHGFEVSPTPVGQMAFNMLGYSHPMTLAV
jgi:hypothetical protein